MSRQKFKIFRPFKSCTSFHNIMLVVLHEFAKWFRISESFSNSMNSRNMIWWLLKLRIRSWKQQIHRQFWPVHNYFFPKKCTLKTLSSCLAFQHRFTYIALITNANFPFQFIYNQYFSTNETKYISLWTLADLEHMTFKLCLHIVSLSQITRQAAVHCVSSRILHHMFKKQFWIAYILGTLFPKKNCNAWCFNMPDAVNCDVVT